MAPGSRAPSRGVEIPSLNVLDDRQLEADLSRWSPNDRQPARPFGSAPPTLPGDDLVPVARTADADRLEHAMAADRVLKLLQRRAFERRARLVGVAPHSRHVHEARSDVDVGA